MSSWLDGRHVVLLNWRDRRHPQAGGAEVYIEHIAAELALRGARVTLVAARIDGAPAREVKDGFAIRRGGSTFGVYAFALLWLLLHRRRVDAVIDCQNGIPFFAPLVLPRRTPVVQVIHHVHQEQFDVFFGAKAAAFGRFLEGPVTRAVYGSRPTVVVSPSTRRRVREALRLAGPCYLVPNGLQLPSSGGLRPRTAHPSIVCVGRLVPQKRTHLLLEALPELLQRYPTLTVDVVGDGACAQELQARARELGLPSSAVVWHGYLPAAERDELLASGWMTVNLSSGEGWGLGVMEAAAFGVPALAFRVDGIRDSVRPDETGWLLDREGDLAQGLGAALSDLHDSGTAARYAKACRDWAASFTWPRSASLLADVLTSDHARLQRPVDRRRLSAQSAVVDLPADLPVQATDLGLRRTDVTYVDGDHRRVLCYDATPEAADAALRRQVQPASRARPAEAADMLRAAAGGRTRDGADTLSDHSG